MSSKKKTKKTDPKTVALIIVSVIAVASTIISVISLIKINDLTKNSADNKGASVQETTGVITTTGEKYIETEEEPTEDTDESNGEDDENRNNDETQQSTSLQAFTEIDLNPETIVDNTVTPEQTDTNTYDTSEVVTTAPARTYTLPQKGDTVNSTLTPYKCITPEGQVISDDFNKELGGEGTSITLNEDGTYSFVLGNIVSSSGTYELDGNAITLSEGYSGTVSYDELRTPIAIIISAENYQVFFN